jgi:hypothetical protein
MYNSLFYYCISSGGSLYIFPFLYMYIFMPSVLISIQLLFITFVSAWNNFLLLSVCRLAADWPETMQIVRLIAQEHMNNKFFFYLLFLSARSIVSREISCNVCMTSFCLFCRQYVGQADFLVFRTLNQHGFLGQLQEKKLVSIYF